MYDISQLNDMLVPELQDIATQQNIPNPKKLDKQELISKILDKQSLMNNVENPSTDGQKRKRKRITKSSAETISQPEQPAAAEEKPKHEAKPKRVEPLSEKKKFIKKNIEEEEDELPIDEKSIEESLEESHNEMAAIA